MLQEWSNVIDGNNENNVISVAMDINGNIYSAGYTKSSIIENEPPYNVTKYGNVDAFISKRDGSGNLLWTRRFGGTSDDLVNAMVLDTIRAVYIVGSTQSMAIGMEIGTNNLGASDGFIAKYDAGGRIVWSKRIGGAGNTTITSIALYETFVYVTGYTTSTQLNGEMTVTPGSFTDGFIAKYSDIGDQLWIIRLRGSGNDKINGNVGDTYGNIYVCGSTDSLVLGNESNALQNSLGGMDGFIAKYDSDGQLLWLRRFGGISVDNIIAIHIDLYNNIYVGGSTGSPLIGNETTPTIAGISNLFIAKYSSTGSLQWITRYLSSSSITNLTSIACGIDNSVFISGTTNAFTLEGETGNRLIGRSDGFIAKFTNNGRFLWTQRTGYSLTTTSINRITLSTGGIIVTGGQIDSNTIDSGQNAARLDGFVSKFSDTTFSPSGSGDDTTSVSKIEYCLNPFNRKSRTGKMSMCSNVSYSNLVTSGNNPKKTKAMQYSSYVNTRKPMKYVYTAPVETNSTSGIITTFAGNGVSGTTGDDGLATLATFQNPYCCNLDNSGNMYISDNSNRVRRIDTTTGIITTIVGNGVESMDPQNIGNGELATSATMNLPMDAITDASYNIYVCDSGNAQIRKVDAATGIITTIAGNGMITFQNMSNLGDGILAIHATFRRLHGIYLDASRNLYIADSGNNRVRKVNADNGVITTIAGSPLLSPNINGDGGLAINANLRDPRALCLDSVGNIYIADTGSRRVRKIDTDGIITTFAGTGNSSFNGDDIEATSANLGTIVDIIADKNNNIYIADSTHQRVRKIDYNTNIITTVAGNGSSGYSGDNDYAINATLNSPMGLSIDNLGNLYIADMLNFVIRKVSA